MKTFLAVFLSLFIFSYIFSQKEDNIWPFGSSSINISNEEGFAYGNSILDFTYIDPIVYYDSIMTLDFRGATGSICMSSGQLALYSNGMSVHDGKHMSIRGADTIGYSTLWENLNVKDYPSPGKNWIAGLRPPQAVFILPWPDEIGSYAVFYHISIKDGNPNTYGKFAYTKIETYSGTNKLQARKNDEVIATGDFIPGGINATKHANGRDWWVVNRSIDRQYLYIYLFDKNQITLKNKIKITKEFSTKSEKYGQLYFSPQGDKLAIAESILYVSDSVYLDLYNFDRTNGSTSLIFKDIFKNNRVQGTLAFSPSGKYMYVSNHKELFQYNLKEDSMKASKKKIGEFDGYKFKYNEFDDGVETEFGGMAHGPDGRIYIAPESSNRYLHTIEFPDEEGLETKLIQRKINLPTSNHVSIPNFPNFRLGPLDGSPADTLGLDNHPIAKFRYDADTLDHLRVRFTDVSYFRPEKWTWDFGDGTSFEGKKPYWHTFPKNGVYNVCLTVSNENSSNAVCREVTIGTSSFTNDDLRFSKVVSVFPNPTDGPLLVTVSEYIPEKGIFILYDMMGREVMKQRVYYGQNNLDLSGLSLGTYVYKVFDGTKSIGSGKIVRI